MSRSTMIIFIIGIFLLIYGYSCRLLSIYFFWDSKPLGWFILVIGLMGYFIDIKKKRTAFKKNLLFVRLGLGLIIIVIAIGASAAILLKTSTAYEIAVERIRADGMIKNEVGDVRGFGLIPLSINPGVLSGAGSIELSFSITVRGSKANRDVKVDMTGSSPMNWTVTAVNIIYM